MKFQIGNEVKVIVDDNCGFHPGHIGVITEIDKDIEDQTVDYKVDDQYYYSEDELEVVSKRIRGFEAVTGFDVKLPVRGTRFSAGHDIASIKNIVIAPGTIKMIPTGLKAYMKDNEWLGLYIRSSVAKKLGLTMANNVGIIDADFYNNPDNEGHIHVMLKNCTDAAVTISAGDRVAQGIFQQYFTTDNDDVNTKRVGGTGSTGI